VCEIIGFGFLGLCPLKLQEGYERLGKSYSVRQGAFRFFIFECLAEASCDHCTYRVCSCFITREVARMLFMTICIFRRVLLRLLVFTGKVVSFSFDIFWGRECKIEIYDQSFGICSTGMSHSVPYIFFYM
jgi:hypothetical protein